MANRFKSLPSPGIFCLLFALFPGQHSANGEEAAKEVGIIFEGSFESPDIARKPPGSESTLMVPFYRWDYGIRPFSREKWDQEQLEWDKVIELTRHLGDRLTEKIEPQLVRDDRGVVQYAFLAAKEPFLSTVVFSEKFREQFKDTLGDRLFIVFIDRQLLYVFPVVGGALEEYGPSLVDEFRATQLPVSLEVFLLEDSGFKVIGELTRDGSLP